MSGGNHSLITCDIASHLLVVGQCDSRRIYTWHHACYTGGWRSAQSRHMLIRSSSNLIFLTSETNKQILSVGSRLPMHAQPDERDRGNYKSTLLRRHHRFSISFGLGLKTNVRFANPKFNQKKKKSQRKERRIMRFVTGTSSHKGKKDSRVM